MKPFRRVFGPNAYWHWQNLDEDRQGRAKGRGWKHGRAWFNFRVDREEGKDSNSIGVGLEWVFRLRAKEPLRARLALGGGDSADELKGHVGLFGTTVYASLESPLARRLTDVLCGGRRYYHDRERELSFRIDGDTLWWRVWANPNEWRRGRPRWRDGNFDVSDFLLGRTKYEKQVIEARDVVIPMPEGAYPAKAELELCTWTRRRFGWPAKRVVRAQIEVEGGIPHPGKGENAWDCGDDATYAITTPADTIEEGISKFVHSVLRDRTRYGGANWSPEKREAA